jgi:hypothetical protein
MKTVVFTSDHHQWLLKGFLHQWEKYKGKGNEPLDLEVAGFTRPSFLSPDVPFFSIGAFSDYPIQRWSDGVIKYLQSITDELVLILLEDYWLMRTINRAALDTAKALMLDHPHVVRFDVAADRMFAKNARYIGNMGTLDICSAKGAYSLSFQASIWRREMLLEVMQPGETPWQAEISGSGRLNEKPFGVVGTYQWPICYLIAVNKGKLDRTGSWMFPARTLSAMDWKELDNLGYTQAEALQ